MTMRAKTLLFLLLGGLGLASGLGCGSTAQVGVGEDVERRVYVSEDDEIDELPRIIGGYEALEAETSYPEQAEEEGAVGVIWVQCRITARGWPARVQIAEGGHLALESEARRAVKKMRFQPALRNDATVPVTAYIPVIFQRPSPEGEGEE